MKILFLLLVLFVPSSLMAQFYPSPEYVIFGSPALQGDEERINELLSSFTEAWSNQDASGVADLHTNDANWTNAFGRTFRGADSLEIFLRESLFPNYPVAVSEIEMQNFQPLSRRYIGSDAAVIHAYTTSQRGSALSGNERRIYFDFVLARTNAGWKIAHQTISDIREVRN